MKAPGTNGEGALATAFARLIGNFGPISVMRYMGEANAHYYASRDPLGAAGDFVTAPEISQMFGELIGLWLADIWQRAGRPEPVHYVELGPGRGTLARDALRAAAKAGLVPQVHLIEASPALRTLQREAMPQARWHDDLTGVPGDGAILLVANEFLDALPVRQLVRAEAGWRERMVGIDGEGRFRPVIGDCPMDAAVPESLRGAGTDTIVETCPAAAAIVSEVATRLAAQGGAALFIDYGHTEFRTGSTLQAIRAHRKADPFTDPGKADLTTLVDFAGMAEAARKQGACWLGTVEQGAWLQALGLNARAEALTRAAPTQAAAIEAARNRLAAPDQMGTLFKVMGLAAPGWPAGAGF
ncbi:MAG: SAM-dependent methyltransferase [Novosphingobium sp.]|jgi:NADH dehydrogenase [ubiquinone] 1 alpha subcomplex assembly factor 7|nr:SAM-dependent methyltransferase [Novosphingobium sp.]